MNFFQEQGKKHTAYFLATIGIVLFANYATFLVFFHEMKDDANIINVSGRQRMLVQRVFTLSVQLTQVSTDLEKVYLGDHLASAVEAMELNHRTLLSRANLAKRHEVYFEPPCELDKTLTAFLARARFLQHFDTHVTVPKFYSLHDLDDLLSCLDRIVSIEESTSVRSFRNLVLLITFGLIAGIFFVLWAFMFVLRPVVTELLAANADLAKANKRGESEAKYLQLFLRISVIAHRALTSRSALVETLREICEFTKWPIGHVYFVDANSPDLLLPSDIWFQADLVRSQKFREMTEQTVLPKGKGLPGRVLDTQEPAWIHDVQKDANFPRIEGAIASGVHSAFAFPIMVQNRVVAVIEFFSEDVIEQNPNLLQLVAHLGQQLGQVFEREQGIGRLEALNSSLDARVKEKTEALLETQEALANAAKMAVLGEMAGGIAHEINTPLGVILLRLSHIKFAIDNKKYDMVDELLTEIHSTVQSVETIISGLRTFSRAGERDRFSEEKLSKIIRESIALCLDKLRNDGIDMQAGTCPEDITISCQPSLISQAILNLIQNARDAVRTCPEKWIHIRVEKHDDFVDIVITDSGKGIPKDIRTKIFEPFFTTKDIGLGTGMGLSLVKGIVESHGGHVFVNEHSPNTEFVLSLPYAKSKMKT